MRLHADVHAPKAAREFARQVVDESDFTVGHELELLVAEVTNNVLSHAPTWMEIRVGVKWHHVRVEVLDQSTAMPVYPETPSPEPHYGLRLVDAFASLWGTEMLLGGKSVWFELACAPRGAVDRS